MLQMLNKKIFETAVHRGARMVRPAFPIFLIFY